MKSDSFAHLLVAAGVVDSSAVNDAEGYDHCATLDRIRGAFARLELEAINPIKDELTSPRADKARLADLLRRIIEHEGDDMSYTEAGAAMIEESKALLK